MLKNNFKRVVKFSISQTLFISGYVGYHITQGK